MKTILLAGGVVLFLAGIGFVTTATGPADLGDPTDVADVNVLADGGTLLIKVQDARGRTLGIERVGTLGGDYRKQELRLILYVASFIPLPRAIERKSELWTQTQQMLDRILNKRLTPAQRTALSTQGAAAKDIPPELLGVAELAEWMRNAN